MNGSISTFLEMFLPNCRMCGRLSKERVQRHSKREKMWYRLDLCAVNTIVCCTECRGVLWCEWLPSAAELRISKRVPKIHRIVCNIRRTLKMQVLLQSYVPHTYENRIGASEKCCDDVSAFTSTTVQRQHAEM